MYPLLVDVIISLATSITVSFITYKIIYSFRPILNVNGPIDLISNQLSFAIINKGKKNSIKLEIEACALYKLSNNKFQTFHFKIDHFDFLILNPEIDYNDNSKRFKIIGLSDSALRFNRTFEEILQDLTHQKSTLRIRFYAVHEISWLGKAFEENFIWDGDKFIKIP
jgi:hypothetical protein